MPKPTSRQLSYLKALANQRGVSVAYPQTSAEASQEINRLKRRRPDSHADRRRERKEIADAIQAGPNDAAAQVRADEVDGHGSQAHWAHTPDTQPATQPQKPTNAPCRTAGGRIELGSYISDGGEQRVIIGQRVDGVVRVSDCPVAPSCSRAYLVERGLTNRAELDALVADYLTQARNLGTVPMTAIPVESTV